MGYMHKWDVSELLGKLEEVKVKESKAATKAAFESQRDKNAQNTFLTGMDTQNKVKFSNTDVKKCQIWKAHQDGITCIHFVPELGMVVSSSYEGNVYIWNRDCEKMGSLVLGQDKNWKISIDKTQRNEEEREEAVDMLEQVQKIDYETMFTKTKKDGPILDERPVMKAIKNEMAADQLNQETKFAALT